MEQLGQGLFNAGLTFKIGSVFVKLQLGKVNHILEKSGKSPDFLLDIPAVAQSVFKLVLKNDTKNAEVG